MAKLIELSGVPVLADEPGDLTSVILPDQTPEGTADVDSNGLRVLRENLRAWGVSCVTVDAGRSWWSTTGPTPQWFLDELRPWLAGRSTVCGLIGVGVGGQAALLNAYQRGDRWSAVAAVAPACDLGRWHGRGSGLDQEFDTADAARQAEAPLFYNPLSATRRQLVWCDPRDAACIESSIRVVSKIQSSGGPVEADLETEAGRDRDSYVAARAEQLAEWTAQKLSDARDRPPLRVLS